MATFVHIAPEHAISRIRRGGVATTRERLRSGTRVGVFAMPVTKDFAFTHQWVRELRRFHSGRLCGVYFRIGDDEVVLVGHYSNQPVEMSVAEAVALTSRDGEAGSQIMVPRRIDSTEITRVSALPQIVGWRYFPQAKGREPCGCPSCQYGMYGARKLRAAFEAKQSS
ncbi:hypothetical protein [Mesorhizobium sp. J428]|uniref:hypothetical protein n=1 Tax=Mesorhizobium sp. J428 TaxID=2898440 RepID=UPI0021518B5A|nr:hypothetical protein [Mesorhizobium sp. J428]MCR5857077.1 hypothetical protein [Mesorhizobium sp. J428]